MLVLNKKQFMLQKPLTLFGLFEVTVERREARENAQSPCPLSSPLSDTSFFSPSQDHAVFFTCPSRPFLVSFARSLGILCVFAYRPENEEGGHSRRSSVRLEHQTLMNGYTIDIWVSRVRASPLAYIFAKVGFNFCFPYNY